MNSAVLTLFMLDPDPEARGPEPQLESVAREDTGAAGDGAGGRGSNRL